MGNIPLDFRTSLFQNTTSQLQAFFLNGAPEATSEATHVQVKTFPTHTSQGAVCFTLSILS